MKLPPPPADLDRAARKAFRNLAQSLVDRGVDAVARARLIAEIVRLECRLEGLREAELQADNPQKMATTRALNVATAELRRLHADAFRGAARPVASAGLDDDEPEADRAWRAILWRGERTLSHAELEHRFGAPTWAALLHRTHAEWLAWQNLVAEFGNGKRIPASRISAMREDFGGAIGFEVFTPNHVTDGRRRVRV